MESGDAMQVDDEGGTTNFTAMMMKIVDEGSDKESGEILNDGLERMNEEGRVNDNSMFKDAQIEEEVQQSAKKAKVTKEKYPKDKEICVVSYEDFKTAFEPYMASTPFLFPEEYFDMLTVLGRGNVSAIFTLPTEINAGEMYILDPKMTVSLNDYKTGLLEIILDDNHSWVVMPVTKNNFELLETLHFEETNGSLMRRIYKKLLADADDRNLILVHYGDNKISEVKNTFEARKTAAVEKVAGDKKLLVEVEKRLMMEADDADDRNLISVHYSDNKIPEEVKNTFEARKTAAVEEKKLLAEVEKRLMMEIRLSHMLNNKEHGFNQLSPVDMEILKQFHVGVISTIRKLTDVLGDGNCGYRAVAESLRYDRKTGWERVRREMLEGLKRSKDAFTFCFGEPEYQLALKALNCFESPCTEEYYFTLPEMGFIAATTYNCLVVALSPLQSCTYPPCVNTVLPGDDDVVVIAIAAFPNHFMSVELKPNSPIPPNYQVESIWKKVKLPRLPLQWCEPHKDHGSSYD